jgi:hypothetical protein
VHIETDVDAIECTLAYGDEALPQSSDLAAYPRMLRPKSSTQLLRVQWTKIRSSGDAG